MRLAKIKVRALNSRIVDFQLFKKLLDEIPWVTVLRDKGTEQSWRIFKHALLRALHSLVQKIILKRQEKVMNEQGTAEQTKV